MYFSALQTAHADTAAPLRRAVAPAEVSRQKSARQIFERYAPWYN